MGRDRKGGVVGYSGRGRMGLETGPPSMPLGGPLVGVSDTQDGRLVEGSAEDLHAERQPVPAEAVRQREHRLAGDVPGGERAWLLPERNAPLAPEPPRLPHAAGHKDPPTSQTPP